MENYAGLVLPTDSASRPATVDALLLVDPRRAEQQRQREIQAQPPEPGLAQNLGLALTRLSFIHLVAGNHRHHRHHPVR